jgi:hypothetical protein
VILSGRLDYETITGMLDELAELAAAALPARLNVLVDETDARPGLLGPSEVRRWIDRWKRAIDNHHVGSLRCMRARREIFACFEEMMWPPLGTARARRGSGQRVFRNP